LTATPREQVDADTYQLFGCESGEPNFAYSLEEAVKEKYLVPYKVESRTTKLLTRGIKYKDLSQNDRDKVDSVLEDDPRDEDYHIPKEKFEFAQTGEHLHDEKLQTKARSYFQDAFRRFRKNKSSVIAACIIAFLILFSVFAPIISPYTVFDRKTAFAKMPPFVPSIAEKEIGILDGTTTRSSQNQAQVDSLKAIAIETGYNPLIEILDTKEIHEIYRGQERVTTYYNVKVNSYYALGADIINISYDEFDRIQAWQDANDIQVLLPWVEKADVYSGVDSKLVPDGDLNKNVWYKYKYDGVTKKLVIDMNADGSQEILYTVFETSAETGVQVPFVKRSKVQSLLAACFVFLAIKGYFP
jgi:hypothetical protein